jgi:dihydrolipoamide dehydrogenase
LLKIFDLVVIGGGVAGIAAAMRAARKGMKIALVEKEAIGGVHVNWGGIPTKALISSVEILKKVRDGKKLGITGRVEVDWDLLQKHRRTVVSQILNFNLLGLKKSRNEIFYGVGEVVPGSKVIVLLNNGEEKVLETKNILIATGSRSTTIPGIPLSSKILDSYGAIQLEKPPESLLVIGGGAVGLEFATVFSLLGTKVTVVELLPRLLPIEEPEVGEFIKKRLEKDGIKVLVSSKVVDVKDKDRYVEVVVDTPGGQTVEKVEKVLMAVGRRPNIDHEKLESLGIKTTKMGIVVNERMQTSIPNVYAAGDVVGKILLLNVAMKEGKVAAENITGGQKVMDYTAVPRCVFTLPEVAAVGLTEEQARKENPDTIVVKDPFFSPRAAGAGEAEGFIKIIAESDGTLTGATIVGSHASELIFPLVVGIHKRINALELAELFYPSPTYSEVMMNALGKVGGKAIFGIR